MAKRNTSVRKSTNDLLESNGENRFQSMYSQAFIDHSKKGGAHNINAKTITPIKTTQGRP